MISIKEEKIICPLCNIMNIVSKKWSLLIVNTIGNTTTIRFSEIKRNLRTINSKVLSDRLKELVQAEIINRKSKDSVPPHVEYSLTDKGKSLRKAIMPLLEWFYSYNEKGRITPCDIAYQIERVEK
ncbi:MAG: winged helix-turn-helix transcriptional regulator [Candidatus Heimdallarchaeota archaeon]